MIMQNYMNGSLLPGQTDPNGVMQWLQQNGYDAQGMDPGLSLPAGAQPAQGFGGPGAPDAYGNPAVMSPRPMKPNPGLQGWDGVQDKLRYLAQQARYNHLYASSGQPQAPGTGGGGGGFGHLIHHLFGGGDGAAGGAAMAAL